MIVPLCFVCGAEVVVKFKGADVPPFCVGVTRALGFNGDKAPLLPGMETGLSGISPVTRLRTDGALTGRLALSALGSIGFSNSMKSDCVVASVPKASRRAFSCLDCTNRKCERSSCHLISSRPSLDLVIRDPAALIDIS